MNNKHMKFLAQISKIVFSIFNNTLCIVSSCKWFLFFVQNCNIFNLVILIKGLVFCSCKIFKAYVKNKIMDIKINDGITKLAESPGFRTFSELNKLLFKKNTLIV